MQSTHLAISSKEDAPLLEGVFFGDEAPFRPRPPPTAAAVAARFFGVDIGEPGEGALGFFPRVTMGESGVVGSPCFAAFPTAATAATFDPAVRLASTLPPDLGEGVGLVAGPRFMGVFLGDVGAFLGLAEEARLAGSLEASILDGDCADPPLPPFPLPALSLPALGETIEDRPRSGEPGELSLPSMVLASRACLMLLNCRRISAV